LRGGKEDVGPGNHRFKTEVFNGWSHFEVILHGNLWM